MRTALRTIPLLVALAVAGVEQAGAENTRAVGVGGQVLSETSPLPAAGVYAYQLADLSLHKVLTDPKGKFLFQDLPAGLYKIIAHKPGFVPVVVMLSRTTAQTYQFVELSLREQPRGAAARQDDFWSLRSHLPGDVLRQIEEDQARAAQLAATAPGQRISLAQVAQAVPGFSASMQAMTGVDQIATGGGQLSGGGLGIEGQLGQMQVGLRGNFWQLSPDGLHAGGASGGQASSVSLDLAPGPTSRLHVSSLSNRLGSRHSDSESPLDFEHYQVNWSQGVGETGRSEVSAQYTAESNYHLPGSINPLIAPEVSRTWRVEGAYTTDLGEGTTLQTGLRFRELQYGAGASALGGSGSLRSDLLPTSQNIDLFGRGGVRVEPAVLLEYGMYSTLSDGSLSLMPQGGIVLQLGSDWQLEGSGAKRAYRNAMANPIFLPAMFEEADLCEQGSESCYQVSLARKPVKGDAGDGSLSLTATHRVIGETLRLYFSNEIFDRLESLYLVRGDQIPELHLQMSKHLSPQVVTKLESSLAAGGGGTFLAADHRQYENRVRYLVASLDTQFLSSSTGVFLAFHQLSQELGPLGTAADGANSQDPQNPQMTLQRLRLVLTQDLKYLFDLSADWAVQLNMEVSRGPAYSSAVATSRDTELRRRLMGGIAVKF